MQRRHFLALSAAAISVPAFVQAQSAVLEFTPGLLQEHIEKGATVILHYRADWCGTCTQQATALEELRAENAAYGETLVFIQVDWDTYETAEITTSQKVPDRSTILALKGDAELGRVIRDTSGADKNEIKDLLDAALAAANA